MKTKGKGNNSIVVNRLQSLIENDRVSHAYLFDGPLSVDKKAFAIDFIKAELCPKNLGENCGACSLCSKIDHDNYEDLHYFCPDDRKSIRVSHIDDMQGILSIRPINERNILIIDNSDGMVPQAQNKLLKILEEPPGDALIIILAENRENLLQTIRSRCVKFRLEDDSKLEKDPKIENLVTMILSGSPIYEINRELAGFIKDRDKALFLMDEMEVILMDRIKEKGEGVPLDSFEVLYKAIHEVEESRNRIKKGMSINNTLKSLVLKIAK